MAERRIPRATSPHIPSLNDALRPLLALGTPASSFTSRYERGDVVIEQNSFTGCDLSAIDAAVASAPAHTEALDVKAQINALPMLLQACFLLCLDEFNRLRQQPSTTFPAITKAQFLAAIKAKVDSL